HDSNGSPDGLRSVTASPLPPGRADDSPSSLRSAVRRGPVRASSVGALARPRPAFPYTPSTFPRTPGRFVHIFSFCHYTANRWNNGLTRTDPLILVTVCF